MVKFAIAGLALIAAPVYAEELPREEYAFQALNALDFGTTGYCIHERQNCREANPLFGKRPSWGKLALIKGATGLIHFGGTKALQGAGYSNDSTVMRFYQYGTIVIVGGAVVANFRFVF